MDRFAHREDRSSGHGRPAPVVNEQGMLEMVRMAWAMLSNRRARDVRPGRPGRSTEPQPPRGDEPDIEAEGFAEEALPWIDAVYGFSLRLVKGDRDAAEDLVQDTFLRAHRFWHTYERGTNVKSWLFTICRNTFLHQKSLTRAQREVPVADFDARLEALSAATAFDPALPDPEEEFFTSLIDDQVLEAIDALPEAFREVLVLSDLGDLKYAEICEVLNLPLGTVKSRLFRARKILHEELCEFAIRAGYVKEPV